MTTLIATMVAIGGCSDDATGWSFAEPNESLVADADAGQLRDTSPPNDDASTGPNEPDVRLPDLELDCRGRLPQTRQTLSDDEDDVIQYDMEIGPNGCPHVVWSTLETTFYAVWDGEEWVTEKVANNNNYQVSISVDPAGQPTAFVANDGPGLARISRDDGRWRALEQLGERWTWGLDAQHIDGFETLILHDASQEYTGTNLEFRVGRLDEGEWTFAPFHTVDITGHRPPRLAVDSGGRGAIPYLQNKGYSPTDRLSNLWIARSETATLANWESERIGNLQYNQFAFPYVHVVADQFQIIAYSRPSSGSHAIVRATPGSAEWAFERIVECGEHLCQHNVSAVDPQDRVHLVYGTRDSLNDRTVSIHYGVDDGGWSFVELGEYNPSRAVLRLDEESGKPHLAIVKRVEEEGIQPFRRLYYVPLAAPNLPDN